MYKVKGVRIHRLYITGPAAGTEFHDDIITGNPDRYIEDYSQLISNKTQFIDYNARYYYKYIITKVSVMDNLYPVIEETAE